MMLLEDVSLHVPNYLYVSIVGEATGNADRSELPQLFCHAIIEIPNPLPSPYEAFSNPPRRDS